MSDSGHYGSPKLLRRSLIALGVLSGFFLLAIATVAFFGSQIDKDYTSQVNGVLALNVEQSWDMISNRELAPKWNTSIQQVSRLDSSEEGQLWQETYSNGASQTFRLQLSPDQHRIIREIEQESSPFKSRWVIELVTQAEDQTEVTITESGSIENPFVRFMTHKILGKDAFIRTYLSNLQENQQDYLNAAENLTTRPQGKSSADESALDK